MRERLTMTFGAIKRSWRRVGLVTIATVGVIALSAGTGYTASQIDGDRIQNQSLDQSENGFASVSGSRGTGNSEVEHQSIGQANIADPGVDHSEIENGGVHERDLSEAVRNKLEDETVITHAVRMRLDKTVNVPADSNKTLETLRVPRGTFVTANVTLFDNPGHAVCSLTDADGNVLAESDTYLGGHQDAVSLSGITAAAGEATLGCHVGDGSGSATDISMASAGPSAG